MDAGGEKHRRRRECFPPYREIFTHALQVKDVAQEFEKQLPQLPGLEPTMERN